MMSVTYKLLAKILFVVGLIIFIFIIMIWKALGGKKCL